MSRLVCKRKSLKGQEALPIGGHRQFYVTGKPTSDSISADYAMENGQCCFGIMTAGLAKEKQDQSKAGCHDIPLYAGLHLQGRMNLAD